MACKIAENEPLQKFRNKLGIPKSCHSFRENCIHHLDQVAGDSILGIPGAIIGYCQALFNRKGSCSENTNRIVTLLQEIEAPFSKSHELFWGNKKTENTNQFIEQSSNPLLGSGRVPILITGLHVHRDSEVINSIVTSNIPIFLNETALVRIMIDGMEESLTSLSEMIKKLVDDSYKKKTMPKWWPLIQGNLTEREWGILKLKVGEENWSYLNIAINPFMSKEIPDFVFNQVTVAQIVIGEALGISDDIVTLTRGVKIFGAIEGASYSLSEYFDSFSSFKNSPTLIVLGPSLSNWSDKDNQARIAKLIPLLKEKCEKLWGVGNRFNEVWSLSA